MSTKPLENLKLFRYYRFITKWSLICCSLFWLGFKIRQGNIELDYNLFIGLYAVFYGFLCILAFEGELAREEEIDQKNNLTLKESVNKYGRYAVIKAVTLKTALFAIIPLILGVLIFKNYPEIYDSLNEAAKAVVEK